MLRLKLAGEIIMMLIGERGKAQRPTASVVLVEITQIRIQGQLLDSTKGMGISKCEKLLKKLCIEDMEMTTFWC